MNATGARFTVVVNHLKSKGSDCNDVGDPDPGDGQGNCSQHPHARPREALVDWLATDPTGSGDPDFLIMGDLNSYAQEDPIDAIKAGADDTPGTDDDFTNLIASSRARSPTRTRSTAGRLPRPRPRQRRRLVGQVDRRRRLAHQLRRAGHPRLRHHVQAAGAGGAVRAERVPHLGPRSRRGRAGPRQRPAVGRRRRSVPGHRRWLGHADRHRRRSRGHGRHVRVGSRRQRLVRDPRESVSFSSAGITAPATRTVRVQVTDAFGQSTTDDATVSVRFGGDLVVDGAAIARSAFGGTLAVSRHHGHRHHHVPDASASASGRPRSPIGRTTLLAAHLHLHLPHGGGRVHFDRRTGAFAAALALPASFQLAGASSDVRPHGRRTAYGTDPRSRRGDLSGNGRIWTTD